jgi:NADH:ubiquinone oxidoreductase subunit 3 (subunit A)
MIDKNKLEIEIIHIFLVNIAYVIVEIKLLFIYQLSVHVLRASNDPFGIFKTFIHCVVSPLIYGF